MSTGQPIAPVTIESVPIGTMVAWPGVTVPDEWHLCDGSVLNRLDYPGLYNAIGTIYNTGGETASQFRLPDVRGRAVFGRDNMGGTTAGRLTSAGSGVDGLTLGARGGSEFHQAHSHTVTDPTHFHTLSITGSGAHYHFGPISGVFYGEGSGGNNYAGGATSFQQSGAEGTGTHTHTGTADSVGTGISIATTGAGSSQNMPPALVTNIIIYTGVVGATGDGGGGPITPDPTLSDLQAWQFACSDETTTITTGTAKITLRVPYEMEITSVRASVNAAPSGLMTIDINKNGSTILSTKLTIDSGEKTSKTAATAAVLNTTSLADDDEITVDVDSLTGSPTGLKVIIYGYRVIS